VIVKGRNIGLAGAQNEGIANAIDKGAQYVLLLDQDSVPMPGMVEHLMNALNPDDRRGTKYAAAGPIYIDARTQRESHFVQIGMLGYKRVRCDGGDGGVVPADALIASGMLIPTAVLRDVGLMDESLFIDHVDTDWCMRARAKGYRMLGVCAARMSHRLGERPSRAIAGRRFFVRSPTRHYYIFRNSILLYRRPYVPLGWCIGDAAKLLLMFAVIAASCTPRVKHIKAMIDGIADGLRGRSGPRP
jgi:rhamnosyltransferase